LNHVLITGAAGFIGSHLVDRLLAVGCRVTGIDNFVRGTRKNVAQALGAPAFALVKAELSDPAQSCAAFAAAHQRSPITMVWHMAANSDISAGVASPDVDHRDTFLTTFYTLNAMRELRIPAIAFASSSAIYGNREEALTENSGPLFPISNYGAMKLASEGLISAALESYLERAWIFRFPNVIGGRATHGVILDLMRKIIEAPERELEVLGDGTQQKPYLHISDLIDAMLFIVEHARDRLNYFNIGGNDEGATVQYIAEQVIQAVSPGQAIRYTGGRKGWVGDVPQFRYSTRKLANLGWSPSLSSHESVRRAVADIHGQLVICRS